MRRLRGDRNGAGRRRTPPIRLAPATERTIGMSNAHRRMSAVLLTIAGLFGTCGVGLSAVAAHAALGETLEAAALMLLVHAAVFVAASALALCDEAAVSLDLRLSLTVLGMGVALFSGDLAARFWAGDRLFAMAAPLGGLAMIVGWIGVAFCGVRRWMRRLTRQTTRKTTRQETP